MSIAQVRRIKPYSGYSSKTPDKLLLDAGVFFKNFKVGTDTYKSAKTDGKCLGATIKGGEFFAKPNLRRMELDGVKTRTVGDTLIDDWETYIKATFAEMTADNLVTALVAADIKATTEIEGYNKITGRNTLLPSDYIENITWIGNLLGDDKPIIIQIYNGLNENGLTLGVEDKNNSTIEAQFYGNLSEDVYDDPDVGIVPPFAIFRPIETSQVNQENKE
jgi:hypothetical protein